MLIPWRVPPKNCNNAHPNLVEHTFPSQDLKLFPEDPIYTYDLDLPPAQ